MALTITSLRVDSRATSNGNVWGADLSYLIVNVCFKIDRSTDDGSFLWERTKAEAGEYSSVLTIDDPERYDGWLMGNDWSFSKRYDGYGRAWTHNDPPWRYLEKFDTFWLREWVSNCSVTRALVYELEYYEEHGKLPSVYRFTDGSIILQHLRALQSYWD